MSTDEKELKKYWKKYSYLDLNPKPFSQAAQAPKAPQVSDVPTSVREAPALTADQEAKAQRAVVKSYEGSWGKIDTKFAEITPMGAIANAGNMTHSRYVALQNAWNTTISQFSQISGDEYLGAYIAAMGLTDDQNRQSTLAALSNIIHGGTTVDATALQQRMGAGQRAPAGQSGPLSPEQFLSVIQGSGDIRSRFEKLSLAQQQQFIEQAQAVVQTYAARGQQSEAIQRAVAAIATGDLTQALNPQEAAELQRAVEHPHYTAPGSMALQLGAHATLEREGSQIVIDPDWARAHPAKAAAEAFYLQQQYPTGQIMYGRGGIASELINAIGKPIDLVAAIPSAVIALTEGKIRQVVDNGDPNEMRDMRDELAGKLKTASLSERDDILHEIDSLNDRIGAIESGGTKGFMDVVHESIDSAQANLGWAENITQAGGLLPGDRAYAPVLGTVMVVGSVAFDPLTWGVGVAEGLRAANTLPKIEGVAAEGAHAVRGLIARTVYNMAAKTPEEMVAVARETGYLDTLAESARTLTPENYAFLLQQSGMSPTQRLLLEAAGDDVDNIAATMTSIIGGYEEGVNIPFLNQKISELGARLNERERLQFEAHAAQQIADGTYDARVAELERHIDEMDLQGLAGSEEYIASTDELERLQRVGPTNVARPTVRPGYVRIFHEADAVNEASIQEKGILASVDKGDVMGRKYVFGQNEERGWQRLAEGSIPEDRIYIEAQVPAEAERGQATMGSAAKSFQVDRVPPEDIIAIHHPGDVVEPPAVPTATAARLDELNATVTADRAEMAQLKSIRAGNVATVGKPFDMGDLRALEKTASKWNHALAELDDGLRQFPKGFISEELAASLKGRADNLWKALAVAFRPSGLEGAEAVADTMRRAIFLPGVTAPSGALVDLYERSREALTNVARLLGVPEGTIAERMGQWDQLVLANNAQESYKWFTETWKRFVLESPRVDAPLKANIINLWDTSFEQWGSDVVRTSAPGEYAEHVPLMSKTVPDPVTGDPLRAGMPVFSSDYLSSGIFLPDMNTIIKAIAPKAYKVLGNNVLTGATSFWKRVILTSKLPFALPSRIVGELLMARMSAFDLASLGNWGVLDWFRSVRGTGEFARFVDDPAFALGGMLDDAEGLGFAKNRATTLGVINSLAGDDYYRALSGRLAHLTGIASPEVRYILDAPSTEAFLASLSDVEAPQALRVAAEHWATGDEGLEAVASNIWNYVHNVVPGTGEFADDIRYALRAGKLKDGTEVGTLEFANRLRDETVAGRWKPGLADVHGKYGVGLSTQFERSAVTRMNDLLMKYFYSKPEAALGRVPAFRQRAVSLFKRLKGMGMPETEAMEVARAAAARDTANTFFRIGAHTYGEAMMRNVAPFFPAWRELTDTWLIKAPERIGGGSRILGGLYMANRSRMFLEAMKNFGVVSTAPDGSMRVNLPFLNPLWNLIAGPGHHVTASFDSLFGVLPFPKLDAQSWTDAVGSLLPGLGGAGIPVQLLALSTLDRAHPGWQKDLADLIAPYGVGNIAGNWSNFYTAMALRTGMDPVPPWEKLTNGDFKEAMVNNSIDDAMRYLVGSGDKKYQPPNAADFDLANKQGAQDYAAAYRLWMETLITDAEHTASASYAGRAILSTVLPVSVKPSTAEQDSITAIWGLLNGEGLPPDLRDSAISPLLDAFKTAYPEADWFTVGKSDSLATRGHHQEDTTDADLEALFSEGLYKVRSPQEYAVWAQGMSSFSAYLARRNAVYAQFENNPVDYLLNGDDARQEISKLSGQWATYLDVQDQIAKKENLPSFKEMLDRSHTTKIMGADDHALQALTHMLPQLQDKLEAGDPEGFAKFRASLYNAISNAAENAQSSGERTMFTTIGKYYKNVSDPYYKHLNTLYDKVNKQPDGSAEQQRLYNEIRHYTDQQKPRSVAGIKFPTPEQVSFFTKTPDEQAAWAAQKLSYGHPEWLTSFQQGVLNLGSGKKVREFTDWVSQAEIAFKQQYPTYTMAGYTDARARLDRAERAEAEARGLGKTYQNWQAPLYAKLDNAGLGSGPGWEAAVGYANSATRSITSRGYVSDSTSPNAAADQKWLFDKLNTLYQSDDKFQETVDTIAVGLGGDNGPVSRQQVFWNVFLDGYGTPPPNLY